MLSEVLRWYAGWGIQQAIVEAQQDLPLLRSIKSPVAIRAVEFLTALPEALRVESMELVARRSHGLLEARPTDMLSAFDRALRSECSDERRRQGAASVSLPRLSDAVRSRLRATVIGTASTPSNGECYFTREVAPDLQVRTRIYIAERRVLDYGHTIWEGASRASLPRFVSALDWLGISATTSWSSAIAGEEEAIAQSLADAASHFMSALERWLADVR